MSYVAISKKAAVNCQTNILLAHLLNKNTIFTCTETGRTFHTLANKPARASEASTCSASAGSSPGCSTAHPAPCQRAGNAAEDGPRAGAPAPARETRRDLAQTDPAPATAVTRGVAK